MHNSSWSVRLKSVKIFDFSIFLYFEGGCHKFLLTSVPHGQTFAAHANSKLFKKSNLFSLFPI